MKPSPAATASKLTLILLAGLLALPGCFTNKGHQGERLYGQHCASCHGAQGQGIGHLVPPLAASDYLAGHRARLACIVRQGLNEPITVNGVSYHQLMLGVQDTATHRHLSPAQITNLLNYIESHWGNHPNSTGPRTIAGTEAELSACGAL